MSSVYIYQNPMDGEDVDVAHNVTDVGEYIKRQFPVWPRNARVYLNEIAASNDVTPWDAHSTEQFEKLSGDFHILVYPDLPIPIIIAIIVGVVAVGLAFLLRPKASAPSNQQEQSPNNSLTGRQNQQRLGQRIPDIGGTVVSIPDQIALPYNVYVNSQKVQIEYMAIGIGKYSISNPLDGTTPIDEIAGSSVEVYDPYTSPNSGDKPVFSVGTAIGRRVISATQLSSVNGQVLPPPNNNVYNGNDDVRFVYPDTIETSNTTTNFDWTNYFIANSQITLSNSTVNDPNAANTDINLDGTYTILSVSQNKIVLANPAKVNSSWNTIGTFTTQNTTYGSASIAEIGQSWVGPFITNVSNANELINNFVMPNGGYKDDGTNKYAVNVLVEVKVMAVDSNNNPIGTAQYYDLTVYGSSTITMERAATLQSILPLAGPCAVWASRVSYTDTSFQGTVVDQVTWADCYAVSPVSQTDFGNVTTVMAQTYATEGSASVGERKLSFLVTRHVQQRKTINGTLTYVPGTDNLGPSDNAADIAMHFALDPYNGNRSIAEVDWQTIYALLGPGGTVSQYFGTDLAVQFGYTFDDTNMSFEELFTNICNAVFCYPYRLGNLLTLTFEQLTNNSKYLFNHRNKVPGSETRTFSFGMADNTDGIQVTFINPNSPNYPGVDTPQTLYFPADGSSVNPKTLTLIGVRNNVQAMLLGWRYYQKLRYQYLVTQFQALEEAELALPMAPILVSDDTRSDYIDGDVVGINGLTLTLSQPTDQMIAGQSYYIFLQHTNGTVESIACAPVPTDDHKVTISQAPEYPLVTSYDTANRLTGYIITLQSEKRTSRMLLQEKTPADKMTWDMKAINYDTRYYSHDTDFKTGVLTLESNSGGYNAGYGSGTTGTGGTTTGGGTSTGGTGGTGVTIGTGSGDPTEPTPLPRSGAQTNQN